MKKHNAFTLLELLVVVAILALLIALLLPSLSRAKDEAKITRCLANLHEIAIALASYNAGNNDLMPSIGSILPVASTTDTIVGSGPGWMPDWGPGSPDPKDFFLMGWMDQIAINGDIKERLNKANIMDEGGHYPTWGYGIMQCPAHAAEVQWANPDSPPGPHTTMWHSDDRFLQGYSLSWCARSDFYTNGFGSPFSVRARLLDPNHIMVAEGNGNMGCQGAWPVTAHMGTGLSSASYLCYGVFERHRRNNRMGATYLMADSHAEYSQDYGWSASPVSFFSDYAWTTQYKGPYPKFPKSLGGGDNRQNAFSHIWAHGQSD